MAINPLRTRVYKPYTGDFRSLAYNREYDFFGNADESPSAPVTPPSPLDSTESALRIGRAVQQPSSGEGGNEIPTTDDGPIGPTYAGPTTAATHHNAGSVYGKAGTVAGLATGLPGIGFVGNVVGNALERNSINASLKNADQEELSFGDLLSAIGHTATGGIFGTSLANAAIDKSATKAESMRGPDYVAPNANWSNDEGSPFGAGTFADAPTIGAPTPDYVAPNTEENSVNAPAGGGFNDAPSGFSGGDGQQDSSGAWAKGGTVDKPNKLAPNEMVKLSKLSNMDTLIEAIAPLAGALMGGRDENWLKTYNSGGHVAGKTDGMADKIDAKLSDGEYVIDAHTVAALGNGNNASGAKKLDAMREAIRQETWGKTKQPERREMNPLAMAS